jgi:hypothetical protein
MKLKLLFFILGLQALQVSCMEKWISKKLPWLLHDKKTFGLQRAEQALADFMSRVERVRDTIGTINYNDFLIDIQRYKNELANHANASQIVVEIQGEEAYLTDLIENLA